MRQLQVLLLLGLLASCGKPMSSSSSSNSLVKYGAAISAPTSLKSDELAAMTEVCNSLKYKRLNYPTGHFGYTYSFDVRELACDQPQYQTNRVTAYLVNDQFVSSYTGNYFKSFETDQSGVLTTVCSSILGGVVPLNTEVTGLNTARQFSASAVDENTVLVTVALAERADSSSSYLITGSEEMSIAIKSSVVPSWRGIVARHKTVGPCSQGSTQTYKILDSQFVMP